MFTFGRRHEPGGADRAIDRAIGECRGSNSGSPALSGAARQRILRAATDGSSRPGAFASLFFPGRLMAAVGLVPAILVTAGVLFSLPRTGENRPVAAGQGVQVAKLGDEVVFTIADGKRSHVVYKSTTPDRFDRAGAIQVKDNRFVDSAAAGPNLVFYRID